jgi:hypothetical protein
MCFGYKRVPAGVSAHIAWNMVRWVGGCALRVVYMSLIDAVLAGELDNCGLYILTVNIMQIACGFGTVI